MKAIKIVNIGKRDYEKPEAIWLAIDAIESVGEVDEGQRSCIMMASGKSYIVASISVDDVANDIWGEGAADSVIQGKL